MITLRLCRPGFGCVLTIAALLAAAGCAGGSSGGAKAPVARTSAPAAETARAEVGDRPATVTKRGSAGATAGRQAIPGEAGGPDSISDILDRLGDDAKTFHLHVTTLGNPWFEGRVPGSEGNERAAQYIEHSFQQFDLAPAFSETITVPGGADVVEEHASYRQRFTVPGETRIIRAIASYTHGAGPEVVELESETDYNPLAFGANGVVTAPIVFAGYSVKEGPNGYSSYGPHDDLTGKIALVLRFEPMDEKGRSIWSEDDGWSFRAGLLPKVQAAEERGAAGVILVNAPGADDERTAKLMSIDNSRIGGRVKIPVIMMTESTCDEMVRAADAEGRSLMDLRRLADAGTAQTLELARGAFSMDVETERDQIPTTNVGAVLDGRGALASEYIVIGAHYDHIGLGKFGSRTPDHAGEVHPGADDNASGTTGLLMVAERLSREYAALPAGAEARSVLFLAFSAEEMGLLGARHFVANPSIALSQIQTMINMDMIGRLREEGLEVSGAGTGDGLRAVVEPIVKESGIRAILRESGQMPSDQTAFLQADVPVLGFFTGTHPEYHTVFDQAWTINVAGGAAIADLVGDVAMALATTAPRFAFNAKASPAPRMGSITQSKVRLGIAPGNYADSEPGVLVGGVSDGTTAWKAGIQKGDRIIRWGGEELADVQAMMARLSEHEPGDKVQVIVVREGKEIPLDLIMQARAGER